MLSASYRIGSRWWSYFHWESCVSVGTIGVAKLSVGFPIVCVVRCFSGLPVWQSISYSTLSEFLYLVICILISFRSPPVKGYIPVRWYCYLYLSISRFCISCFWLLCVAYLPERLPPDIFMLTCHINPLSPSFVGTCRRSVSALEWLCPWIYYYYYWPVIFLP